MTVDSGETGGTATAGAGSSEPAVLDIRDLAVSFFTRTGEVRAVDRLSLTLRSGERWGLVGESGSGKSVTARAVLGLVERPGRILDGEILFEGRDLLGLSEAELRQVRGKEIALVFQNPSNSLNPVLRTGRQLEESLRSHVDLPHAVTRDRALSSLRAVGISEPVQLARGYPHEFSGGMQQRLYIAMSIINEPKVLIADEPTTALDVTIQAQILDLLRDTVADRGMTLLLITHNMGVVANICDRVAVMYAGEVVETARVDELFDNPLHPYSRALLRCLPDPTKGRQHLEAIPGSPPTSTAQPAGCRFRERCSFARDICSEHPDLLEVQPQRSVRCWVAQAEKRLPDDA